MSEIILIVHVLVLNQPMDLSATYQNMRDCGLVAYAYAEAAKDKETFKVVSFECKPIERAHR